MAVFETRQHLVEAKSCEDLMTQIDAAAARIKQMNTDLANIRAAWNVDASVVKGDVDALDALKADVAPLAQAATVYILARQA